eukprot:TRINITY_DN4226_c0_g1_i6.p1 TRINITY_DN4226_c0_g1~~TRINITY_DN4226_c0_g1_i6.p1  ORF type:complete len:478 (-),score=57.51 TRINITY_DN4226_c0_g1_i6:106-1485(-)
MGWGPSGGNDAFVDTWVQRLGSNDPNVTALNILSFRKLTSEQFVKVYEALHGNTTVKELCTSGHRHWPDMLTALRNSVQNNSTLESVSIGSSDLGNKGLETLSPGLQGHPSIQRLDLEFKGLTDALSSEACDHLMSATALQQLVFARNELGDTFMTQFAQALSKHAQSMEHPLELLDLSHNHIGDSGCVSLCEYLSQGHSAHLKQLHLSHNKVGNGGIQALGEALACNTGLTHVHLHGLRDISPEAAASLCTGLRKNTSLQVLDLTDCDLKPEHSAAIRAAVQDDDTSSGTHLTLTSWILNENKELLDSGIEPLHPLWKDVRQLSLDQTGLTWASVTQLTDLDSLTSLSLFGNGLGESATTEAITQLLQRPGLWPQLRDLNLGGNKLDKQAGLELLRVLADRQVLPALTELGLGGNDIEADDEEWLEAVKEFQNKREDLSIMWRVSGDQKDQNVTVPPH